MAWFKQKTDPISAQARALNEQIAALESQIKKLDSQITQNSGPKLRSTTLPPGVAVPRAGEPRSESRPAVLETVFEEVNQAPPPSRPAPPPPELINEFGGRKFDLPAWWNRWCEYLRGPAASNPRLVSLLAAGGVHGLRPMGCEKRIQRRRFFGLVALLLVILFLILCHYYINP
jgi:hypothetical protein